jgi:hypothetical protein
MKVGVTGTREGATDEQILRIIQYMFNLGADNELHHGDCVGADIQVAAIAKELGWKIVCHPPEKTEYQGSFGGDELRPAKDYYTRNRNIVNETEVLMVVPKQSAPQKQGGTWYTHDYAVKNNKPVEVFYP